MKNYRQLTIPKNSAWNRKPWTRFIHWKIRYFFQGVYNIFRWMPTIYKDRHWDHSFITDLLQKKLEFVREELVTANRFVGIEAVNKDLTLALNLLERIRTSHYELEMHDYIKTSFDFIPLDPTGDYLTMEETILEDHIEEYLDKYKHTSKKLRKKYKLKRIDTKKLALRVSDYNQQKCERIFWKLIHYKINHWWD